MDMLAAFKVQKKIAKAAPLAFAPCRIAHASLTDATQSLDRVSAHWIGEQVLLNPQQHLRRRTFRQLFQPGCESARLDEEHNSYIPLSGISVNRGVYRYSYVKAADEVLHGDP